MCNIAVNEIIGNKQFLDTFYSILGDNEIFTSIDISNKIKKDGFWIRNSDVCGLLAKVRNHTSILQDNNYMCTYYDGIHIYHPENKFPTDYSGFNQKPFTKNECEQFALENTTRKVIDILLSDDINYSITLNVEGSDEIHLSLERKNIKKDDIIVLFQKFHQI